MLILPYESHKKKNVWTEGGGGERGGERRLDDIECGGGFAYTFSEDIKLMTLVKALAKPERSPPGYLSSFSRAAEEEEGENNKVKRKEGRKKNPLRLPFAVTSSLYQQLFRKGKKEVFFPLCENTLFPTHGKV